MIKLSEIHYKFIFSFAIIFFLLFYFLFVVILHWLYLPVLLILKERGCWLLIHKDYISCSFSFLKILQKYGLNFIKWFYFLFNWIFSIKSIICGELNFIIFIYFSSKFSFKIAVHKLTSEITVQVFLLDFIRRGKLAFITFLAKLFMGLFVFFCFGTKYALAWARIKYNTP